MALPISKTAAPFRSNVSVANANQSIDAPSSRLGINDKIAKFRQVLEEGVVSENLIDDYFAGFKQESYQGVVNNISKTTVVANSQYQNQNTIEFEINPPEGYKYNPSELSLVLPIQFMNPDGTELSDDVSPANAWISRLIELTEVFQANTDISITPPSNRSQWEFVKDKLDKIPKKAMHLIEDIQYCDVRVTKAKRKNNAAELADRTDANIDFRLKNFHAIQKGKNKYTIPLGFLSSFFECNDLTDQKIKIVCSLETNNNKIFETTRQQDDNDINNQVGKYTIWSAPLVTLTYISLTGFYKTYFNQIFGAVQSYRYGTQDSFEKKTYEIATNQQQIIADFQGTASQFDRVEISIQPRVSLLHGNPYNSYNVEEASKVIKKLIVSNVKTLNGMVNMIFDFDDYNDKQKLYKNYLGKLTENSSLLQPILLKDNELVEELPSFKSYWDNPHRIVLDVSPSNFYTSKPDPIQYTSRDLTIEVQLRDPVGDESLSCAMYGICKGEYSLIKSLQNGKTMVYSNYTANAKQ